MPSLHCRTQAEEDDRGAAQGSLPPASTVEARSRARLLHETIRGALQVMHRDFFDDENPPAIPSASLEDVFTELNRSHHVQVKWLTIETDVLNIDHQPADEFEKQAVTAIARGRTEFEASDTDSYQYVGAIRLASQCLKCHVKNRTSTEARTAGLVIRMPLAPPPHRSQPGASSRDAGSE